MLLLYPERIRKSIKKLYLYLRARRRIEGNKEKYIYNSYNLIILILFSVQIINKVLNLGARYITGRPIKRSGRLIIIRLNI